MRLIGTLDNERQAVIFSQFLQQKGISHQIEIHPDTDWGSPTYGLNHCQVWIHEEEHLDEILQWFHLFVKNPQDPFFNTPTPSPVWIKSESSLNTSPPPPANSTLTAWDKQPMGWITRTLLIVCSFLFFLSHLMTPFSQIPERYAGLLLFTSPIEKALLYDYPKFYELITRFIQLYGYEEFEHSTDLPIEGQQLLQQINRTPFWPGFYHLVLKEGWHSLKDSFSQYPSFEKIKKGQLWRFFTPCLLHGDLFHIFFNMLWLIVLGKQIEQRLQPGRYILLILLLGIVSNTAQYLMSGPNFIGFSGILCGMLAFIWVRQKQAAWEGYQIDRMTLIFMLIFVIGMALIQLLSFFLEKSYDLAFSPNIANMAHLVGGMTGFLLGKLNFFGWRHP